MLRLGFFYYFHCSLLSPKGSTIVGLLKRFFFKMISYQEIFPVIPYTLKVEFNQDLYQSMTIHGTVYELNLLLNIHGHFLKNMQEEIRKIHMVFLKKMHHYPNMVERHVSKPNLTSKKFPSVQEVNSSIYS